MFHLKGDRVFSLSFFQIIFSPKMVLSVDAEIIFPENFIASGVFRV